MSRRFIAEWEAQEAVVLAFPEADTDWIDDLEEARKCVIEIAQAIARFESVYLICKEKEITASFFDNLHNIVLIEQPFNDTWMRDCIALSIEEDKKLKLLDFTFTGWGGKFDAHLDNELSRKLFDTVETHDFILEGGGIESDGKQTLMTTSSCLLNPNRNSSYTKSEVETYLTQTLGSTHFLWLDHGHLEGDDTDGHIDTLARFCDEKTIAYVGLPEVSDSHYESFLAMKKELEAFRNIQGMPYTLVALPFVPPCFDGEDRLPATYANFLIINGAVLVPTYGVSEDKEALEIIATIFPDREIIGIDCQVLIKQHGSLHCMTMQIAQGNDA